MSVEAGEFTMNGGAIFDCTTGSGNTVSAVGSVKFQNDFATDATIIYGKVSLIGVTITPGHFFVEFKDNNESYATEVISTGNKVVLPDAPVHTGYTFLGWYDADSKALDTTAAVTQAMTFAAQYSISDPTRIDALETSKDNLQTAVDNLNTAIAAKADAATLNTKVSELNTAIETAESVVKAYADTQDTALKETLESEIADAQAALTAAIDKLSKELDGVKNELNTAKNELVAKDESLQTFITIVCVVSGVSFVGGAAFVVWFFIDRKKKI